MLINMKQKEAGLLETYLVTGRLFEASSSLALTITSRVLLVEDLRLV